MKNELYKLLKIIKNRKAAGLADILPKKTRKFDDMLLWLCNTVYKKTQLGNGWNVVPFPSHSW